MVHMPTRESGDNVLVRKVLSTYHTLFVRAELLQGHLVLGSQPQMQQSTHSCFGGRWKFGFTTTVTTGGSIPSPTTAHMAMRSAMTPCRRRLPLIFCDGLLGRKVVFCNRWRLVGDCSWSLCCCSLLSIEVEHAGLWCSATVGSTEMSVSMCGISILCGWKQLLFVEIF